MTRRPIDRHDLAAFLARASIIFVVGCFSLLVAACLALTLPPAFNSFCY